MEGRCPQRPKYRNMMKVLLIFLIVFEMILITGLFAPVLINRREHTDAVVKFFENPTQENTENFERETFINKKIVFIHRIINFIILFLNSWGIIIVYKKK